MNPTIDINPVSVWPGIATKIQFNPASISYGQSASADYFLLDADGQPLKIGKVTMSPEEYALWGDDDGYAIDCFLSTLNLERAPSPDPQP